MSLRSIPRTAVDSYLKLVKWPLERGASRVGGEKAELAVDRADATVRATAASVLGDTQLREDAERRFTAADERERAMKLRLEAELKSERADEKLQERKQSAAQQKQAAAKRAAESKARAEKARQAKKKNLEEVERRRREAAEEAAAKREETIASKERRERLETLNKEAEALEEREEALVAKDEAQRLGNAAAAVKEARKSS